MADWKPTYDLHASRDAAVKDAERRQRQAREGATGRTFAVRRKGAKWTVMYREPKGKR